MFLPDASTRRPIAMSCLLIALLALGLNSFRKMSLEDMPQVDIPYVTVITTWIGATAEDIEKDVSKHIEDAVAGIDGLKHINSDSLENVSSVVLEFNMGVNVDIAAQDVREKVDTILDDLPRDAKRPVIQKLNINALPIANIFLSGDASVDDLYDYADNTIADHFATVPGVAEVQVVGGNEREIWIELDRAALIAAGLTSYEVAQAVESGILSLPGGRIREAGNEISLRFDAEYTTVAAIADLEVASRDGARRRLADLGTVRFATEEVRERAILDGKQGVVLKVVKKAEGNTVAVVRESRKRFEEIRRTLPGGMELTWVSDESADVVAAVDSAVESVWQAIVLCALILFIFLVNIRTTVIVAITMPATVIISLFFMHLTGQTLNTVTLLAIGLSTGVLVSNSIVVLENIVSKFEVLDNRWEAARNGANEVTVAIMASAGTNVIVMLPLAMMSSLVGKMLGTFAITTLIVNAVSILISFTLTPILCAMLLQPVGERRNNVLSRLGQHWLTAFQNFANRYAGWIRHLAWYKLLNTPLVLGFIALFVVTLLYGGKKLGITFFENDDHGRIFIRADFPPYYDLEKTVQRLNGIQSRLLELSDIEHVLVTAGKADAMSGQASTGVYLGQIELFFKDKTRRDWGIAKRLAEVRAMLSTEPDALLAASMPAKIGGQVFTIDYNLSGSDLDTLESVAADIRDLGLAMPDIDQLNTTVRERKSEIRVKPKRTVLSDLGISAAQIGMVVRANIDGIEAADYKRGDRTYDIRVKLTEQPGREQIKSFMLPGLDSRPIPLETVADVEETRSTVQIYRVDKQRTVKILGDIAPGATMSEVDTKIVNAVAEGSTLPAGYNMNVSGMSESMDEAMADFGEALLLAAFLTLLTLAAILESWSRPALVLLTLPMGLIGIIWSLILSGQAITVFVLLGALMLIGVVVNAAILIVDKTAQNLQTGMDRREAMINAVADQFRPVLMVVLASGLGMLPIAISTGIGSENRVGIGIASVGGIIVAGIGTLTILPLVYTLTTRRSKNK